MTCTGVPLRSKTFTNTNAPMFRHRIANKAEKQISTWTAIFFIRVLNWRELKSIRAASKVTWHLLHKYSPSLHLGDLYNPFKSLEGEQSAVLAFYVRAQKCTRRPNLKATHSLKALIVCLGVSIASHNLRPGFNTNQRVRFKEEFLHPFTKINDTNLGWKIVQLSCLVVHLIIKALQYQYVRIQSNIHLPAGQGRER